MQCGCSVATVSAIKGKYKEIVCLANQARTRGEYQQATEYYQQAFYQVRMLFRLPQIPEESIQYLVTACTDCVDFCRSEKPSWLYLKLAIKELNGVIKSENHSREFRAKAMQACIQISSCLTCELESGDEYAEVVKTINEVERVWQAHGAQLAVIH